MQRKLVIPRHEKIAINTIYRKLKLTNTIYSVTMNMTLISVCSQEPHQMLLFRQNAGSQNFRRKAYICANQAESLPVKYGIRNFYEFLVPYFFAPKRKGRRNGIREMVTGAV